MLIWSIWVVVSAISAISGVVSSRRYLHSKPYERGGVWVYQSIAALNYVLFAFGLLVMAWYVMALGVYADTLVFWLQGISCVMNVAIAMSALRKANRIMGENVAMPVKRRLPQHA